MIDKKRYENALAFAAKKHEGQFRIGGLPYITHPVAVAEIVKEKGGDTDAVITALFHDLLEDTDATEEEILFFGNKKILHSVKLLTKQSNYVMQNYVEGIRKDGTAFLVKGADRLHNLRSASVRRYRIQKKIYLRNDRLVSRFFARNTVGGERISANA